MPDADGKKIKTDEFVIKCGVIQGDILSPLLFILALDRKHDNTSGKGACLNTFPPTCVTTLGYADDFDLTDDGDEAGLVRDTDRESKIVAGSRESADMEMKIVKTKVLHVLPQDPVTETTNSEVVKESKFVCPHLNCGFRFFTK